MYVEVIMHMYYQDLTIGARHMHIEVMVRYCGVQEYTVGSFPVHPGAARAS